MARPSTLSRDRVATLIRARGPISATELAALLGVNRTTIGRALHGFGEELVGLGAARSTRYVLRRSVRHIGDHWPIHRIDSTGRAREWAVLESYHDHAWRIRWAGDAPVWADRFTQAHGLWGGFPFFLHDIRPQGFLGRIFAQRLSRILQVPADPRQWSDEDALVVLASEGEDLPGDLVVGEDCLRRALAVGAGLAEAAVVGAADRSEAYVRRAQAISESPPGSSAGGEQPKFLVSLQDPGTPSRAALVKFTPPMDQDTGRRWADLLVCEFHAHQVLAKAGLADPGACLLDAGGRRFLEVPRFDRSGAGGRIGVVTLEALAASTLDRFPADWPTAAAALQEGGWIDAAAVATIRVRHCFGELIGNTDMHAGNLAFFLTDQLPFHPAPSYDMLPMLWAPGPQGEILDRRFAPAPPVPAMAGSWHRAATLAHTFWHQVAADERLSASFQQTAQQAALMVERLRAHAGMG